MFSRSRRLIALTSALVAAALAVGACGSSTDSGTAASTLASSAATSSAAVSSGNASPAADQAVEFNLSPEQNRVVTDKVDTIAAEVPQAIRDRGTIKVTGTAGTAPPLGFYATDDATIIGSEIDFANLIASVLGL